MTNKLISITNGIKVKVGRWRGRVQLVKNIYVLKVKTVIYSHIVIYIRLYQYKQ